MIEDFEEKHQHNNTSSSHSGEHLFATKVSNL